MQPIAPLMIEHRLIERIVPLMGKEAGRLGAGGSVAAKFIAAVVDFFRTYADRCHHGKEEDILFAALRQKDLTDEHGRILKELLAEHVYGRETVGKLSRAETPKDAAEQLNRLIELYPKHIEKEDRHFFIPVMQYFTQKEQDEMLNKMWVFDKKLIHEKYEKIISEMERTVK